MRILKGAIASNKMLKTVVVRVDHIKRHPRYRKHYRVSRKYKADVADAAAYRIGDVVRIAETRPFSREKRWRVLEVITRAPAEEAEGDTGESESPQP